MTSPVFPVLNCPPEYVMASWIATIPGFVADSIDPVLPADSSTWQRHGAVTMFVVGGTEHPYVAYSKTVLQVETWCCNPGSDKPPWLQSWALARQIRLACLDRINMHRPLPVVVQTVLDDGEVLETVYPAASARSVMPLSVARRVYGQRADYAGHIFDLVMTWTQDGLTTR